MNYSRLFLILIASFAAGTIFSQSLIWHYQAPDSILFTPTVGGDGYAYFGCNDKKLYALKSDGTLLWSIDPGGKITGTIAIQRGVLYFPTGEGKLCAYSTSGNLVWKYDVGAPIRTSPALAADGTIYFGSDDYFLYALNPNGTLKWKFLTDGAVTSNPSIGWDGTIYFASSGFLYALNDKGKKLWEYPIVDPNAGPIAIDITDYLYVIDGSGILYNVGPDGILYWSIGDMSTSASPVLDDLTLYISLANNKCDAIDYISGDDFWTTPASFGGEGTPAISSDGSLYLCDSKVNLLVTLDTADGTEIASISSLGVGGDVVLYDWKGEGRIILSNDSNEILCYSVPAGPLAGIWSQRGATARHLSRRDEPPEITINSPSDSDTVSDYVTINTTVIDDFDPSQVKVNFLINGTKLFSIFATSDGLATFTWNTYNFPDGEVTIGVEAVDSAGNIATNEIPVTISNGSSIPKYFPDAPPASFYFDGFVTPAGKIEFSLNEDYSDPISFVGFTTSPFIPIKKQWKKILSFAKDAADDTNLYWEMLCNGLDPCAVGSFIISKPLPAVPLTPEDGSVIEIKPSEFKWDMSHNSRFRLEFSDTEDFSSGVIADSKTKKKAWVEKKDTYKPSEKKWKKIGNIGNIIYWRIVSRDSINRETVSTVFSIENPSAVRGN